MVDMEASAFFAVANFRNVKGNKYLINAIPLILEEIPNAYFILLGDGPDLKSMQKLSEELGVSQKVVFTGSIQKVKEMISIIAPMSYFRFSASTHADFCHDFSCLKATFGFYASIHDCRSRICFIDIDTVKI